MAGLIQEFLEFYRLDYSLAIFKPETNLSGQANKEELAEKAGIGAPDASQPLLLQLLNAFNSGAKGNASDLGSATKSAFMKEEVKKMVCR